MAWRVEAYQERSDKSVRKVVNDEALDLRTDEDSAIEIAELVGWLEAVVLGEASPLSQADVPGRGDLPLFYRCSGRFVMIFGAIPTSERLVVLRFALAASAYPTVADCTLAAGRWVAWSARA